MDILKRIEILEKRLSLLEQSTRLITATSRDANRDHVDMYKHEKKKTNGENHESLRTG